MAFERKNKLEKALGEPAPEVQKRSIGGYEGKKTYTFTMSPSRKEQLVVIAKERNRWKSPSTFLNDLIPYMDDLTSLAHSKGYENVFQLFDDMLK